MSRFQKVGTILGLTVAFCAGIFTEALIDRRTAPRIAEPIQTDFCFLARNTPLFVGRRFVTSANLKYGIDSAVLKSPACPKDFAVFRLNSTARGELPMVPRYGAAGDITIPVSFEGTIVPRSRLMRWRESFYSGSMLELITIEHISSPDTKQ
jgi:hypothetical protein